MKFPKINLQAQKPADNMTVKNHVCPAADLMAYRESKYLGWHHPVLPQPSQGPQILSGDGHL